MNIPMLSDLSKQISRKYKCLIEDPTDELCGASLRATYIIDHNLIPYSIYNPQQIKQDILYIEHVMLYAK